MSEIEIANIYNALKETRVYKILHRAFPNNAGAVLHYCSIFEGVQAVRDADESTIIEGATFFIGKQQETSYTTEYHRKLAEEHFKMLSMQPSVVRVSPWCISSLKTSEDIDKELYPFFFGKTYEEIMSQNNDQFAGLTDSDEDD